MTRRVELDPSLPEIKGVYSDFSQSFNNIIKNALDAMREALARTLTVKTWHDTRDLFVKVSDTGRGIDPSMSAKLFQPFQSTKPLAGNGRSDYSGGTGLGLFMVSTLLKRYGARFSIESTPGVGTSVTVCLPRDNKKGEGSDL